jgi:hypothetical protein
MHMKSESRHPCIVVAHVQVSGVKGKWIPKYYFWVPQQKIPNK